jgi:dihydropteroate synthase-like protein
MHKEQIHFVTGRLAEHSLRAMLERLSQQLGFRYTLQVMPITVAALMTTDWIAARLAMPSETTRVILPGYVQGNLAAIERSTTKPIELGPRDLRRLPEYLGGAPAANVGYGGYDIEIIAEINHAPKLTLDDILQQAQSLRADGADVIDIGCNPGETWMGVGDVVAELVARGYRVSIDSLNPLEIAAAAKSGAELVLSVNSSNRAVAADWGCEVVAIPDSPSDSTSLDETVEFLAARGVRLRIDPILEPIGFGFAASLGRYLDARRRYSDAEIMMGIGNLTELTDVDSAGVNVLLLGICQELGVRSVLTTQVINWARSSVRECDLARRLVHQAVVHRTLPKLVDPRLFMLRDEIVTQPASAELDRLAGQIKDHNYRLFTAADAVHAVSAGLHLADADPFLLFERLLAAASKPIDASHAFYLGYEMCKAATALALGKNYEQDEALDWGFLTRAEQLHRLQKQTRPASERGADPAEDGE